LNKTKIEWCDATLNPVVGCTFNCEYCYARKMNQRFNWVEDFNKPKYFPERLKQLESKKPKVIFMNSLSDIADWTLSQATQIFDVCRTNKQHTYLFLTKRFDEWYKNSRGFPTGEKNWFGLTVDTQERLESSYHIPDFLSIEPILEPIYLRYTETDFTLVEWVIIGAETGNRKGKVTPEKYWIDRIVKFCDENKIPVFMKNSLIPIIGEENMRRKFPWEEE